jgi:hypothetical protein
MAKAQTKSATKLAEDTANRAKTEVADFTRDRNKDLEGARGRRDTTFNNAFEGLNRQRETGGFDPERLAGLRSTADNLTRTGGYDQEVLGGLRSRLSSGTGGFDPEQLKELRSRGAGFMDTGGYDQEELAGLRSGYRNFAETGGFSDTDKTNFLNRATGGTRSTFNVLREQDARAKARSGGYGSTGSGAQFARLLAQQQSEDTLGANTSLHQQINANKFTGLKGGADLEGGVAGNRLNAFNTVSGLESNVATGNRANDSTLANLETDVAGGIRSGADFNRQVEQGVATGSNQANQGMIGLFQTATGEVSDIGKQVLSAMGLDYSTQEAAMKSLTELSKNPGLFQTALNNIIGLSGAASGILGAFPTGGLGRPSTVTPSPFPPR